LAIGDSVGRWPPCVGGGGPGRPTAPTRVSRRWRTAAHRTVARVRRTARSPNPSRWRTVSGVPTYGRVTRCHQRQL